MNFAQRHVGIEGVGSLLWPVSDHGAFNGPLQDWIEGRDFFMQLVQKKGVVVQAGGNCGMYPVFYSKYFEKVYTFEPDEDNFHCLEENCKNIPNIVYTKGGLGRSNQSLTLEKASDYNVGEHRIVDHPGSIPMFTIDNLNLPRLDLLHLDIEGFETQALIGAIKTIHKFKPIIITERSHGYEVIQRLGYTPAKTLRMDTIFHIEPYNLLSSS